MVGPKLYALYCVTCGRSSLSEVLATCPSEKHEHHYLFLHIVQTTAECGPTLFDECEDTFLD